MLTDGDVGGMTDLGGMTTMSLPGMSLATPNTFGPQSTLVILFNFTDLTTQPFTSATAQSITFTDANNFDLENSFGQTSLVGTVDQLALDRHVEHDLLRTTPGRSWPIRRRPTPAFNLANYPRRVYAFPHATACSWIGLGTVGGGTSSNPSRAWINGSFTAQAVAHEMGHNFGLYHSHSNTCDSTGCVVSRLRRRSRRDGQLRGRPLQRAIRKSGSAG